MHHLQRPENCCATCPAVCSKCGWLTCASICPPVEQLYELLSDTLEEEKDDIQPAFFHPEWSFSGVPESDPIHFEKRAPYATINLLRRESLNRVVEAGLERGAIVNKEIAEHNAEALKQEGYASLANLFREHLRPRDHSA